MIAAHVDQLRTLDYHDFAGEFLDIMRREKRIHLPENIDPMAVGKIWCDREIDILRISSLFHVSDSMAELAKIAAQTSYPLNRWSPESFPATNGAMVFETPLRVLDIWGRDICVQLVTWRRLFPDETDRTEWRMTIYSAFMENSEELQRLRTLDPYRVEALRTLGTWSLCHMETLSVGERLGKWHKGDDESFRTFVKKYRDDHRKIDMKLNSSLDQEYDFDDFDVAEPHAMIASNMFRFFYTIFDLMSQTVADLSETQTDRRIARRRARGKKTTPPMVTVIKLRHEDTYGRREEGTGTWLTYRSTTRGHWRTQHYGPQRQETKRIWIHPYERGPKDAPYWQPTRVTTLAR